jgi:hypothetical protein
LVQKLIDGSSALPTSRAGVRLSPPEVVVIRDSERTRRANAQSIPTGAIVELAASQAALAAEVVIVGNR